MKCSLVFDKYLFSKEQYLTKMPLWKSGIYKFKYYCPLENTLERKLRYGAPSDFLIKMLMAQSSALGKWVAILSAAKL